MSDPAAAHAGLAITAATLFIGIDVGLIPKVADPAPIGAPATIKEGVEEPAMDIILAATMLTLRITTIMPGPTSAP